MATETNKFWTGVKILGAFVLFGAVLNVLDVSEEDLQYCVSMLMAMAISAAVGYLYGISKAKSAIGDCLYAVRDKADELRSRAVEWHESPDHAALADKLEYQARKLDDAADRLQALA
jgi:hypothetical protein